MCNQRNRLFSGRERVGERGLGMERRERERRELGREGARKNVRGNCV
jgi:hypothetical protein